MTNLPFPLGSSWFPPHNNNSSNHTTRTGGPTTAHWAAAAAAAVSLRLGDFLRRRLLHGHSLSLVALHSSFEDAWNSRDSQPIRFNFLQTPNDLSSAFSSLLNCFGGIQEWTGDGKGESSSSGKQESTSSGTSRNGLFDGRHCTSILLAINLLMYGAEIATQGKLLTMGAKINTLISKGELWRLVTSSFLHADIWHLMINCYSLNSVGPTVEYFSGPRRFLVVYFISAVASSAMSYWRSPSPSLGASGAIFGLVGATAMFLQRHRTMTKHGTEHMQHIGHVLLINLAIGLSLKNIDNWGHLGGFLGGIATTWFLGPAWELESTTKDGQGILVDNAPVFHLLKTERPRLSV